MNNGKICVSVCAETAVEFIENIKQAAEFADVIELRFDCLQTNEIENVIENLPNIDKPYLATFRPKEQGGKRELSLGERLKFWESFLWANKDKIFWVDFEFDMSFVVNLQKTLTIASSHDFSGISENLSATYEVFSITNADVLKTAVQANDITNSIAVWKLLERAKKENKQIIPIAMGEAGKWTRILGLAHGAFMIYAALDAGRETASGQFTAQDLIDTYRVKKLNEQTEIYGIVGNPVSHSVSPFMHNAAFKLHNLNAVYIPFEVKNLDEFIAQFIREETREIELNYKGFSVTIPHKQAIIKHLDSIDETAKAIGAVNTVKIIGGKLYGYNTDAHGFIEPLINTYGDLKNAKVAVLGGGGAARAAIYALKKEGAEITIFARNIEKAKNLAKEFQVELEELKTQNLKPKTVDVLINATPLGTIGEFENETPAVAEQIKNVRLVYDLVYNP
ncbi:MAG: shikimate dehydrogenase, partial [Acidobacteriota bacterium]|nr:shikimate dehydrogenase [Acidobacteriota bacterium]